MLVSTLIEDFLSWSRSESLSEQTLYNMRSFVRLFAEFCDINGIDAEALTVATTRTYLQYLQDRGSLHNGQPLSGATRRKHFDFLGRFSRFLVERKIIDSPLTAGVRRPVARNKVIHGFDPVQLRTLIETIGAVRSGEFYRDRFAVLIYLIASTGVRIGEALRLSPKNFDFNRRLFTVLGKGDIEREVPFSFVLLHLIELYIKKYQIQRDGLLFASRYGRPLSQSTVRDALRKIKLQLGETQGIDRMRVSPHTFRHSFARAWIVKDGNTIALSRILGHSSLSMTMRYARLWGVDTVQAYDACDPVSGLPVPKL